MPAQLVSLDNGASITLDKPILLVGRHPECDIQIDSRKISRRHCCIAQVANYLVIRDLGSTNGIRINGRRVNEGKLEPGDEVTIGNNRYQLSWDSIAPSEEPPVAPVAGDRHVRSNGPVPGRSRASVDELLESCDEPVPLDDDVDDASPLAQRTPPPPSGDDDGAPRPNTGDSRIPPGSLNQGPR